MFKITYKFVFWIGQLSEQRKLSAGIMLNILLQKKDVDIYIIKLSFFLENMQYYVPVSILQYCWDLFDGYVALSHRKFPQIMAIRTLRMNLEDESS